jgi:hypothetical protein
MRRILLPMIALALVAAACGGDSPGSGSSSASTSSQFAAQVATTDLYTGTEQRVQVGIFSSTAEGGVQLVSYGDVQLALSYLGNDGSGVPVPGPTATASYLVAPGLDATGTGPVLTDPVTARGVYQAGGVVFDQAGIWQADVTADVQGVGALQLSTQFPVQAEPQLPAPGQRALKTKNLTTGSTGVPDSAIDSRALDGTPIPDRVLHRATIAEALAHGRPILVTFGTPLYCASQFCGPTTDAVQGLAHRYGDRAEFIHIEIWKDFQKSVANQGAADWLYRNGDLTEPWLYLIGADGVILDRWGPLFAVDEIARDLAALPPMKG